MVFICLVEVFRQGMPMLAILTSKTCRGALSGERRSDLIVRLLRRDLSCLLIMTLMLLSAITFSTKNIPDFNPACRTINTLKVSDRTAVTFECRVRSVAAPVSPPKVQVFRLLPPAPPVLKLICFPSPSRSPPVHPPLPV